MQVSNGSWKTTNKAAQKSFVHGERSFRAYLAGGNVRFLETAKTNFEDALRSDRQFDLAKFYLGVTQTQLRETEQSIQVFEELLRSGKTFQGQLGLQLAYAHIKVYEDAHYLAAKSELDRVNQLAGESGRKDLQLQAQALQVFLYSVMAGRFGDGQKRPAEYEQRPQYARLALELGDEILRRDYDLDRSLINGALFDTYNGLGIVWTRIGEARWNGFPDRAASWAKSQAYFDLALRLRPNAVPVLQNIGTLRLAQAEEAENERQAQRAKLLRTEAKELYERSLEFNDHDQFPFYRLANIAVREGDKGAALDLIRKGKERPGAVKAAAWEKVLLDALALPDPS